MNHRLIHRIRIALPWFSLVLSLMCLGTIMCFLFPEVLTTPKIRSHYPIALIRELLYWSIFIAAASSTTSLIFGRQIKLILAALLILGIALILGGSQVPLKEEYSDFTIQFGLDWFLLDLFILAIVFIPIEKFYPLKSKQRILKPELKTDLVYFAVGHLGFQAIALFTQRPVEYWYSKTHWLPFQEYIEVWPMVLQICFALLVADLTQYGLHRAFHQLPALWKFHKIHHSIKSLDWLAGSRLHLVDIFIVRTIVYFVVMSLGVTSQAFVGYVLFTAFQTVFIHCNVRLDGGWLKHVFVLPRYHHWHHHDRPIAYDKNFAIHFPIIDRLFGTYYLPKDLWPDEYGIEEDTYPQGYWGQFMYPFRKLKITKTV